jgi:Resolvase, N terminal domain
MKIAAAYGRAGSVLQGDPREVQQQAKAIQRYAKGRGVAICETYVDAGVSGAALDRLALQEASCGLSRGKDRHGDRTRP